MRQLSLFPSPKREKPRYPWQRIFPDWMPVVGGTASIHSVITNGVYSHMDKVRILAIDGDSVTCQTIDYEGRQDHHAINTYHCTMADIWPNVYE